MCANREVTLSADERLQAPEVMNYPQYTKRGDIGVTNLCTPIPGFFPLRDTATFAQAAPVQIPRRP